ncbi:hypothetical protein AcW1_003137 [Taiwanofungus camphoratus]|nr:hypothetical protein AcV7_004746 [Antrodia cinnamomea]KAI0942535.1 hypothetical protein AcW1_003137 [Antrodia cinnamomea]
MMVMHTVRAETRLTYILDPNLKTSMICWCSSFQNSAVDVRMNSPSTGLVTFGSNTMSSGPSRPDSDAQHVIKRWVLCSHYGSSPYLQ